MQSVLRVPQRTLSIVINQSTSWLSESCEKPVYITCGITNTGECEGIFRIPRSIMYVVKFTVGYDHGEQH